MIQPAENTNTRFMVESPSQSEFTMKSLRNSSRFDYELAVASVVLWLLTYIQLKSNIGSISGPMRVNQRTTFTIDQ